MPLDFVIGIWIRSGEGLSLLFQEWEIGSSKIHFSSRSIAQSLSAIERHFAESEPPAGVSIGSHNKSTLRDDISGEVSMRRLVAAAVLLLLRLDSAAGVQSFGVDRPLPELARWSSSCDATGSRFSLRGGRSSPVFCRPNAVARTDRPSK